MPTRAELTLGALGLIQHTSPASLQRLAQARGLSPTAESGVYDLARALIEPGAVWYELSRLDGATLLALESLHPESSAPARHGAPADNLLAHLIEGDPPRLRSDVQQAIDSFRGEWLDAIRHSLAPSVPPAGATDANADDWTAVIQALPRLVDTVDQLCQAIVLIARNTVSQRTPQTPALVKALTTLAPEVSADWPDAADWGVWSGLLLHSSSSWWVSSEATGFCEKDRPHQLAQLVESWWAQGEQVVIQSLSAGAILFGNSGAVSGQLQTTYPLLDTGALDSWLERGKTLSVFTTTGHTPLLRALVNGENLADVFDQHLPPPASGVYPDGVDSLVAAGPLSHDHRERLTSVAHCVRAGMSPRWVVARDITLATLVTLDAKDVITRLDEVIIGGVPSGMATQITEWQTRAQSMNLSLDARGTVISTTDDYLGELLLVDQKLQMLHLTRPDSHTLITQRRLEEVRGVLQNAGYPTFPTAQPEPSWRVLPGGAVDPLPESWWAGVVDSASQMAATAVWTEEVLRDAIAERTLLTLCIRIGDTERWMDVEPQSVSRGRLRVKDTVADVERTLPIDTIVSMAPTQPGAEKNT